MLAWQLWRNLEKSFKFFLIAQVLADSVTDANNVLVPVRVGRKENNDWTIPCISLYVQSETAPRLEIGSNLRDDKQLIIIDIYATNSSERIDLAKWVTDTINNGFRYYAYSPNPTTPDSPTKVAGGWVSLDFLTNARVELGQNTDPIDANRHRISITIWISGS